MTPQRATVADLAKIQKCAEEFYASSRFLEGFDLDRFCALWTELLENDAGVIFAFDDGAGQWAGMFGGIAHPDIYSGSMTACEMFWFTREGYRGQGLKLYRAFEQWATEKGCKKIMMIHLCDSMPEKLERVYKHLGFQRAEIHYVKGLA